MISTPIRRARFAAAALLAVLLLPFAQSAATQVAAGTPAAAAEPLRVMTFNIRYNNPADGPDAWPHRQDGVAALIRYHDADLIGLQEAQIDQLRDLERLLPEYARFGLARDDGRPSDEYSSIMYRSARFEVLDQGMFWLSETPNVPGSRGWDARFPRIATWGRFRDRSTGDTILQLNTHFDHIGVQAREESARLLARWLAENSRGLPVIVTGDLNTLPESAPIQVLLDPNTAPRLYDAFDVSEQPHYGPNSTWNRFREVEPGRRIDFIFVGDGVRVRNHAALTDRLPNGRFPSDHLPVIAEVVVERR
jgi:endonuclease/exonuclease/phosphatase family metal-dependent hydrolase